MLLKGGEKMEKIFKGKSLKMTYENGVKEDGSPKYSTNSISNINKDATDENLYAIKGLLAKVQNSPIVTVSTVETNILSQ